MTQIGKGNERLDRLQVLVHQNPDDPFLQYALGLEWEKRTQWEQAKQTWQQLLVKQPDYLPAWQKLSELCLMQEMLKEAFDFATEARLCAENAGDRHAANNAQALIDQILEQMNEK